MRPEIELTKKGNAQSGSRGFLAPSPHNTLHAGPHRAFQDWLLGSDRVKLQE
jgi:hypothetical protein